MKSNSVFAAVLLLGIFGCSTENSRVVTRLNEDAALTGDLPVNPLKWRVITSAIDHRSGTMYTVFGNDQAVDYARTHTEQSYPVGTVLSLVTWNQQDDPRWFGGRIPKTPKAVEFVTVQPGANQQPAYLYEDYEGAPLKKVSGEQQTEPQGRAAYLLAQRAAVMP
jgi:hypothetical protein